jgi:histone H1/5
MIKEAILAHPAEARAGIGRATIKKYIQSHHPETAKGSEATFNTRVNQAITRGAEKKTFVLPKGPSGKVKLAPKAKAEKKPATTAAAKKPAAKKAAVAKKPAAAAKKPAAKKVSCFSSSSPSPLGHPLREEEEERGRK